MREGTFEVPYWPLKMKSLVTNHCRRHAPGSRPTSVMDWIGCVPAPSRILLRNLNTFGEQVRQKQWCHGKKVCSLRFPATYRGRKRYGLHLTAALGTGWQSHTWSDHLPKPLRSAEDWSGTSRCSSGKQQTQGSGDIPALVAKDRQPRSVAERSLLLEHHDGVAFVERLRESPRRGESGSSNWVSLEPL